MRQFWSNRKGNVAVLFAFTVVPLIGAIGAATDYSMAAAYRTDLQKSLDSTALTLTKLMPAHQETLETVGMQYFMANLGPHKLSNLQLSITAEAGHLTLTASGTYHPQVASLLGIGTFDVGASSEAKWSLGKMEIALVLDVSLSMNSLGRIEALREATNDLINVLEDAEREPGDAKVAIAAFDGMINVGYTYSNAPAWVRFDWWDENVGQNVQTCTGTGWKKQCTTEWVPEPRENWAGCVYDRDQNHDVLDTVPSGSDATKYPAAKCHGSPPQAITPLSTDWAMLRNKADNLTPTGWTNITIGLVWGWHLLSPSGPDNQGTEYGTQDVTKYVILMTDGHNTKNIWRHTNACPSYGPCPDMNARTQAVCDNIKAPLVPGGPDKIKIYSVRLIEGNEDLIRNCATDPSMYYDVQSASQLAGVFSSIGAEIANLHLSK